MSAPPRTEPRHVVVGDREGVWVVLHLGQHGGPPLGRRALGEGAHAHHHREHHLRDQKSMHRWEALLSVCLSEAVCAGGVLFF